MFPPVTVNDVWKSYWTSIEDNLELKKLSFQFSYTGIYRVISYLSSKKKRKTKPN
jgi:hypothetical protein